MVTLYDTTLRDGTQREGLSLSVDDKLRIVERLDDIGVRYVEGGWPGSNPRDEAFFKAASSAAAFSTVHLSEAQPKPSSLLFPFCLLFAARAANSGRTSRYYP